uniref:Uncharacterized protein n=1 Tax=Timema cristinae TaxID=61476 RepID=A0A7R9CW81_TIMCR|nr:unnamed protein product [Timema cristinae]
MTITRVLINEKEPDSVEAWSKMSHIAEDSPTNPVNSTSLWIGFITETITEEMLRDLFSNFTQTQNPPRVTFKGAPNLHNMLVHPKFPDPKRIQEEKSSTKGSLRQRMNIHCFDTNHKDLDKPVPIHACTHNQDFQTCYTTKILEAFPKQCNSSQLRHHWEPIMLVTEGYRGYIFTHYEGTNSSKPPPCFMHPMLSTTALNGVIGVICEMHLRLARVASQCKGEVWREQLANQNI